jgi:hypothetical protein
VWQRWCGRDSAVAAEVAHIAALQQAAAKRRAEYAAEKERAALAGTMLLQARDMLSLSRKRVEEAETAHTVALQAWDNKQSRQRSH